MRLALLAVLAFTSCDAQGWSWQRYSAFRDFGSFQGIDALGAPLASTQGGELRFDDATYSWKRVELPGAGAHHRVALSGREFASTYGIYRKERGATDWQLYDLEADPGETRDLALEHFDELARLAALAECAQTLSFRSPSSYTSCVVAFSARRSSSCTRSPGKGTQVTPFRYGLRSIS